MGTCKHLVMEIVDQRAAIFHAPSSTTKRAFWTLLYTDSKMDYVEKGKWMLEALDNTHNEQIKTDLLYMSICCGKLALENASMTKHASIDSLKKLIAMEPQFEHILAAAADSGRMSSSSSCGESFYKIDVPDDRVEVALFANKFDRRSSEYINVRDRALPSHKSNIVSRKDLLSFEKEYREQFRALYQMLGTLSPPQKHEADKLTEIKKEEEDIEAISTSVLRSRQQQLEIIIDVLVTRLEQERKEKAYLLQKLVDCNHNDVSNEGK